ncbi:MAG TPA: response regulator [Nitrospiraceae bacterium]|nr:response regulator [Nitrospiraceae bacterium]
MATRVLIVDDDPALLHALPETVKTRMREVAVETSDTAPEALKRISETDYDAIITDIKMPGMDGLALLGEIRTLRPDTPTLLITGHGEHELAVQALRGGAYDFIQKPIDRDYFVASLGRAVQVYQLKRQVEEQKRALARHAENLEQLVQARTRELMQANAAKDAALAQARDEIAQRKKAEEALQRLNEQLEQRVADRTHELTKLNVDLVREIAERRLAEEALHKSREELRALAARLLTVQEEERRRISCELHDDLNQKLAVLVMNMEAAERRLSPDIEKTRTQLQSLRNETAELSDDVRRLAYRLHPSILDHLGLAIALQSHVEEFGKREEVQAIFTQRDLPESVPQPLSTCLYRVAQEALRNVAKHARASRVAVRLRRDDECLHLSIFDSGIGFKPPKGRELQGLGFVSMQERVRLVGGRFDVKSRPGRGTYLSIRVPLSNGAP